MSRIPPEPVLQDSLDAPLPARNLASNSYASSFPRHRSLWLLRCLLSAAGVAISLSLSPWGLRGWAAAGLGLALAIAVVLAELRLRRSTTAGLIGGAAGGLFGIVAALLADAVIARTAAAEPAKSLVELAFLLAFAYLGVALGAQKSAALKPGAFAAWFASRPSKSSSQRDGKLVDTSVLIDGRLAEICEAHFLDGPLLVPQFVLHELQMIADSPDSLRRQRGRRGLEVLQRIQKLQNLEVRIIEDLPGQTGDVDHKLVELALRLGAKIVTNDFNLNKVASVQGIDILNVNLLANALRPAVLPGEGMRVFILREGKEVNQGVAYLEDGTMVVVDGARRLINKTVDILVTSVHQTPAGKMIFGRIDDRNDSAVTVKQAAAVGRSERFAESASDRGPRPLYPDSSE